MVGVIAPTADPTWGATIALPGGGFASIAFVARYQPGEYGMIREDDIVIQTYDRDGQATGAPIVAVSGVPDDAAFDRFGVSVDGNRFAVILNWPEGDRFGAMEALVVSADGQSNSGLAPLTTPLAAGITYNDALEVLPTADGGFLMLGIQRYLSRAEALLFVARLSAEGEQIGSPVEGGLYISNRAELVMDDRGVFLLSQIDSHRDASGAVVLRRLGENGEAMGEPVILTPSLPAGAGWANFAGAEILANGDLLVSWNNRSDRNSDPDRSATFQRFDLNGEAIGDAVVTKRASGFAALQDGGFVVLQDTLYVPPFKPGTEPTIPPSEQSVVVFDQDSNAVGELQATGIHGVPMDLADGRILVGGGHIFDYPASHDAQWGGNQAYIATWQEQELLSRQDGIGMLRSDAGVAMKPWIANFEAASDADGINATANAMANHLLGGNGANVFIAAGGNDKLYGLGGNDWLLGQDGNDLLDGGDGHDVLLGGLGNDSVAAGAGADTVTGDDGDDAIGGGAGHDLVQGGTGQDFVHGDGGNDTLAGGAGRDWVNGGAGDDIVSGDRDADTLEGGSGADQFRFGAGSGQDVILDFEYGAAGDRIVIDVAGNGTLNGLAISGGAGLFNAAEDTDDGVLIALGEGHSILLAGLAKADLGADMFLLV